MLRARARETTARALGAQPPGRAVATKARTLCLSFVRLQCSPVGLRAALGRRYPHARTRVARRQRSRVREGQNFVTYLPPPGAPGDGGHMRQPAREGCSCVLGLRWPAAAPRDALPRQTPPAGRPPSRPQSAHARHPPRWFAREQRAAASGRCSHHGIGGTRCAHGQQGGETSPVHAQNHDDNNPWRTASGFPGFRPLFGCVRRELPGGSSWWRRLLPAMGRRLLPAMAGSNRPHASPRRAAERRP